MGRLGARRFPEPGARSLHPPGARRLGNRPLEAGDRRHQSPHPSPCRHGHRHRHRAGGVEGRVVLGIGRGDSSLAHLGLTPADPSAFERYLIRLQGYLRGEDVPFDADGDGSGVAAASGNLGMASGPETSRIRWIAALGSRMAKVPVDVAATGSRVIR